MRGSVTILSLLFLGTSSEVWIGPLKEHSRGFILGRLRDPRHKKRVGKEVGAGPGGGGLSFLRCCNAQTHNIIKPEMIGMAEVSWCEYFLLALQVMWRII